MPEIVPIVLAAGASRRFGTDKLLHPLTLQGKTRPLVVHALKPWLQVFERVTVVVSPQCDALRSAATKAYGDAIDWVACPDAAHGMSHSLVAGVAASADAAGWLIGLADMPLLNSQSIALVRDALIHGAPLGAAFHEGKRGHPVGFAASYRNELLALRGDRGARAIVVRDSVQLVRINTGFGVLRDVDTPADLNFQSCP